MSSEPKIQEDPQKFLKESRRFMEQQQNEVVELRQLIKSVQVTYQEANAGTVKLVKNYMDITNKSINELKKTVENKLSGDLRPEGSSMVSTEPTREPTKEINDDHFVIDYEIILKKLKQGQERGQLIRDLKETSILNLSGSESQGAKEVIRQIFDFVEREIKETKETKETEKTKKMNDRQQTIHFNTEILNSSSKAIKQAISTLKNTMAEHGLEGKIKSYKNIGNDFEIHARESLSKPNGQQKNTEELQGKETVKNTSKKNIKAPMTTPNNKSLNYNVDEVVGKLDEYLEKKKDLGLQDQAQEQQAEGVTSRPLINLPRIFGRNNKKDQKTGNDELVNGQQASNLEDDATIGMLDQELGRLKVSVDKYQLAKEQKNNKALKEVREDLTKNLDKIQEVFDKKKSYLLSKKKDRKFFKNWSEIADKELKRLSKIIGEFGDKQFEKKIQQAVELLIDSIKSIKKLFSKKSSLTQQIKGK